VEAVSDAVPQSSPTPAPRRAWWRRIPRFAERVLAVVGLTMIVYHTCFELSVMVSPSMAPALKGTSRENGDWILTEKVSYRCRPPRRWEVVAFYNLDGIPVMKRVVGLPGETLSIREKWIAVNGKPVDRPAALRGQVYYGYGNLSDGTPVECGQGYFVMGDDSIDSQDSRYEGPVRGERIRGRVWLIVWPFSRARFVTSRES